MTRNSKKQWQLVTLLAFDLAMLILISSLTGTKGSAMHIGSDGERVFQLQQRLSQLGLYSEECDGIYSLKTRSAVKSFQKSKHIEATGKTDYETLSAMGIDSRTALCFSTEAELLARCISQSGCISYSDMLNKGIDILEQASGLTSLGEFAANICTDTSDFFGEPSCRAYSAAVQAMRLFSQQTHGLF